MTSMDESVRNTLGIESLMVANTQQIRQIAGNARRWNLPYQLDFRVNTMLDQAGLHTLLFDEMSSGEESPSSVGSNLFLRCLVYYKMVGCSPDDPMSGFLSMRFRDFLWLQTPEGDIPFNILQARTVLPRDEFSPQNADPASIPDYGPAQKPGTLAAYSFRPGNEPSYRRAPRRPPGAPPRYLGEVPAPKRQP